MTVQERFAEEYGMPLHHVEQLVSMAKRAGHCNEKACNGDPHAKNLDRLDKNANAQQWEADVSTETVKIADLVRQYGFTEIVYTGLGPTLKRGDKFVEIPY